MDGQGGPKAVARGSSEGGGRSQSVTGDVKVEARGWKGNGHAREGHGPRNAGGFQKPENGRKHFRPSEPPEGTSPVGTLT